MERVICINDELPEWGFWAGDPVVKGNIYTVRGSTGGDGVLLVEVRGKGPWGNTHHYDGSEVGYKRNRFAPVRKTNIEIFRKIDRDIFKKKKITA